MNSARKQAAPAQEERKTRETRNPVGLLASHAIEAMLDKKARDIVVMDMREVSGVADLFVIGTGDSNLQIRAVADAVKVRIKEHCEERPWHVEGTEHYQWVLLDYVDLVVHVFNEEKRTFYDLERLWGDADVARVPDEGSAADVPLLAELSQGEAGDAQAGNG